jgi:hypothetical protein
MTDVPTLTSATAANYATLNPLSCYVSLLPTNGNLQYVGNSGNWRTALSTIAVSSGKWYCEMVATSLSGDAMVGIENVTSTSTMYAIQNTDNTSIGRDTYGFGYLYNANKYTNGTSTSYGASWTANDVIGIAMDLDSGTLVFYKNGVSQGTAFTGLSGTFAFAVSVDTGTTLNCNFGQQPWTYTPPSGFVALNTYNL